MKTKILVEPITELSVTGSYLFEIAAFNNSGAIDISFEEMCLDIESFPTLKLVREDEVQRITVLENEEPIVKLHFQNILPDFPTTPKIKKDEQY